MRNQRFQEPGHRKYPFLNHLLIIAVTAGLSAGVMGVMFPQAVFYETARYYSGNGCRTESVKENTGLYKTEYLQNPDSAYFTEYFTYFLSVRVLVPFVLILAGILWKNISLLFFCVWAELASISFHAVLLFGAGGMDAVSGHLMYGFLPDICYVLSLVLAFCEKKSDIYSKNQYIITVIKSTLLLCCGALVEIYLFSRFQH